MKGDALTCHNRDPACMLIVQHRQRQEGSVIANDEFALVHRIQRKHVGQVRCDGADVAISVETGHPEDERRWHAWI